MKLIYAFRGRIFHPFHHKKPFPVFLPPPVVRASPT